MCNNKCNNCCCSEYDGKCVKYTGVDISLPFSVPKNTDFNVFVWDLMEYLRGDVPPEPPVDVTLTYSSNPADATIIINGEITNEVTVESGSTVIVSISRTGYETYSNTFSAPDQDTEYNIVLDPIEYTVSFVSTPPGAVFTINGVTTNTITAPQGTLLNVTANLAGYVPFENTYTIGSVDQVITILLTAAPPSFTYYWGEIGNIFAPTPSGITEFNWDNQIKPDGTNGGMNTYNAASLLNSYQQDATGFNLQWWIILIPQSANVDISDYRWFIFDELSQLYVPYLQTVYDGVVSLDGVDYNYSAIRPSAITRIQFKNNT